jgi:hypothetical protein
MVNDPQWDRSAVFSVEAASPLEHALIVALVAFYIWFHENMKFHGTCISDVFPEVSIDRPSNMVLRFQKYPA